MEEKEIPTYNGLGLHWRPVEAARGWYVCGGVVWVAGAFGGLAETSVFAEDRFELHLIDNLHQHANSPWKDPLPGPRHLRTKGSVQLIDTPGFIKITAPTEIVTLLRIIVAHVSVEDASKVQSSQLSRCKTVDVPDFWMTPLIAHGRTTHPA